MLTQDNFPTFLLFISGAFGIVKGLRGIIEKKISIGWKAHPEPNHFGKEAILWGTITLIAGITMAVVGCYFLISPSF